eukprot:1027165-Rhodomonas_salina.1
MGGEAETHLLRALRERDASDTDAVILALKTAMPRAELWPVVWKPEWARIIAAEDLADMFSEGLREFDDAMPDSSVQPAVMMLLLQQGFTNHTESLMRAMVARRSKRWLAALTVPSNSAKKALNEE